MFSYDLVEGHRWLLGHENLLHDCTHHRRAGQIPLFESTRLLVNRLSGMLFTAERLAPGITTEDDADYVGRNLAKAQLALGDAILAALGKYHWSCRARDERFQSLEVLELSPWMTSLRRHHADGVQFKLHPIRHAIGHDRLHAQLADLRVLGAIVWLWLENRRLGTSFYSTLDYALSSTCKHPESPIWKNVLLNLRAFESGCGLGHRPFRNPHERLLHALTLLLWESVDSDKAVLHRVQGELQSEDRTQRQLVQSYQLLWQQAR